MWLLPLLVGSRPSVKLKIEEKNSCWNHNLNIMFISKYVPISWQIQNRTDVQFWREQIICFISSHT